MRKGVKVIVISGLLLAALGGPALFADYVEDGAPVCVYSGEQEYPVICVDENANAFIAWEDRRGYPDIYAQMINDKGARLWAEAGVAICTATYGQYGPRTCSDGAGGAIIAWTDARASNVRDIYAQRIGPDGNISWTANGVPVCTEAGHQYLYDICADGRGGAILVWQDERVSSSWDDIYCQRINENGIVLWNATGVPLSTGISFLREKPQVVPDGKGGGIFTWIDWGSGGIFGQRVNAAGTIMWDANGSAICDASGNQYEPKIVPDGLGGALITWYDHRSWYDIYIQRVDSIGNMLWTANGVQLTEDAGADIWQAYPRLCSDNEGGAIVAWVDQRDSDYDCYAQRVDGSGVARWTANGVPVCVAEESCDEIALVAGPDKSAILIWEDFRSGVGKDIYTQQLDSLGIAQWDENGIALCLAANSQYDPRAVTDNAGGAIVTWYDERVFGDPDIYAHRITHQGDIAATLLQGFFASCRDEAVFIEWTLSELDPGTRFTVYRAVLPGNDYYPLPEDNISREGLTFSYRDGDCSPGSTYSYQVEVESRGVKRFLFRTDPITPPAAEFVLHQNYPNPFNPSTTISYYLPEKCRVTLRIYDSAGREVCRLLDGFQEAGPRSLTWAGMNGCGEPVQSGVYYYSLTAGKETRSRKMLLLR